MSIIPTTSESYPKSLKYELTALSVVFIITFFFPFCTFYYSGEDDMGIIEEPQYLNDFIIGYGFILYYIMLLSAILSKRRSLVIIMNTIAVLLLLFTYFITALGFNWWGASPYHPKFNLGYLFVNLVVIYLIIRSATLVKKTQNGSNKTSHVFGIIAIAIPSGLVLFFIILTNFF